MHSKTITWFFDLDNTLHNASHAIFKTLDERITTFIQQRLGVTQAAANALRLAHWTRYGATLLGLAKHHGISGPEYFAGTHAFDVRPLLQFERGLARRVLRVRGRKILLTNAPLMYAKPVMVELDLQRRFDAHIAIDHMRINGQYVPKPSRRMLRRVLAQRGIAPRNAILVEDSAVNLKAAKAIGMKTVLVRGYTRAAAKRGDNVVPVHASVKAGRAPYVDCCVHSVAQLHRIHWLNQTHHG
jgi:putative hydrolase of the HAD superfamily